MIKLNLGSGTSRYEDYISVDYHTDADLKHDLTQPLPYEDESVDAIYSSHVIEHFTRAEWQLVRKDWARVIKPGGTIEIRCPDILKLAEAIVQGDLDMSMTTINLAITRLYGAQIHDGDYHKNGFHRVTLQRSFPDFRYKYLEPSTDYELHMRFTK